MRDLIELAERCEAADGNSDTLFMTAFEAIFGGRKSLGLKWARFCTMLDAEAYESAALMLVPDGAGLTIDRYWIANADGPVWSASVVQGGIPTDPRREAEAFNAATPALAICAASLRAIAGEGE